MKLKSRKDFRRRRHFRVRKKVFGTAERPRMAVFVSNKHMYVQFIDDEKGHTLAAVSTLDPETRSEGVRLNRDGAAWLGRRAAEIARAKGIEKVVFDRGGHSYGLRLRTLADAARKAGLEF
ncbi:MAG: 50S ribosomal protein L18 [Verrucomicrobia bacterium]|nr:MAG: 50S ribosomal protein L18 [Verrucomicrobiota bacterium]